MPDYTFNPYYYDPMLANPNKYMPNYGADSMSGIPTNPNISGYYPTPQSMGIGGGNTNSTGAPAGGVGDLLGLGVSAASMGTPLGWGTLGLGLVNTAVGLYGLSQMGDAPNYTISPELRNSYQRAEGMTSYGFTPEEMGAAESRITRSNNTAQRNALDMSGGNLSGAVRGAINAQNLTATNELAALDARQRRQNIQYADSVGGQVSAQRNLATAQDIDQYNKKQQSYGQAGQSGLVNTANFLNLLSI